MLVTGQDERAGHDSRRGSGITSVMGKDQHRGRTAAGQTPAFQSLDTQNSGIGFRHRPALSAKVLLREKGK
jgi:hypothetical protein